MTLTVEEFLTAEAILAEPPGCQLSKPVDRIVTRFTYVC